MSLYYWLVLCLSFLVVMGVGFLKFGGPSHKDKRRSKELTAFSKQPVVSSSQVESLSLLREGVVNGPLFYDLQRQDDASMLAWTRSILRGLKADVEAGRELSVFVPNQQHPLSIRTTSEFNEWAARHFSWFLAELRD